MAPLRDGECMQGRGQKRQDPLEGVPRIGDAVQEDDGLAVGRALFDVLEPDLCGQLAEFLRAGQGDS